MNKGGKKMIFEHMDRIVFAGDSVTDMESAQPVGEGLFENVGKSYVRIVENMLAAFYPEIYLRVTNSGISGNTSRDLLQRFDRDVVSLKPDWVSICIGINDVWRQFDSPAIPDEQVSPEEQPEEQPEADPELDTPEESDASYAGSVVVVGDRAMEIPTRLDDLITSYADAIDNLASAMGPDVRTISLITPNGGEFYSPESLHTGEHSQKDMIEFCYSQMNDKIVTVDAYSKLRSHTDEYIYFRTDHHWTQLGAYYAYTAFCEAAGFEAVPLEQFQTGRYDTFLGSMYGFTEGYPQSEVLKQHPDYLEYYLPIADTHARYYANGNLENGTPVSVVYTELGDSVSNKYLCFIGGDTPICIVESDVPGPTCIVLKESYGNAFVPFLTSHYGRIIVIDPREFNRDGKPSLNLAEFAADQGVDDLIVINYPYMINSKAFIRYLNALAGVQ